MNCIYCGTPLSAIDYCTGCGADITLQKRINRISNLLYNEGLEKATVRDLSGAINCLKRSLKFNKENIAARNLLGLVYFETGEVVSALSEWVISKNMNAPNNAADLYIAKLQTNKNKLDTINQTIRKYNQALFYCREDNDDMAVIQLKKVLSQNPRLIKAYHLLSLLYLKRQEYEKARKLLRKAALIDNTNTTTLRFLQEIETATGISTSLDSRHKKRYAREKVNKLNGTVTYMSGNDTIIQPTTFRDSSAAATFINIFLGLLLGGAIVYFLVVPGTRQNVYEDANQQVTDANSKVAAEAARVQALEKEIDGYKAQIEEANQAVQDADEKADSYDEILKAADLFVREDQEGAGKALGNIDETALSGAAKDLYDNLMEKVNEIMFPMFKEAADTAYLAGNYAEAIKNYEKALEANPDDYETMRYLGMAYYNSDDTVNANRVFREIIQKFPEYADIVTPYMTSSTTGRSGNTADGGTANGETTGGGTTGDGTTGDGTTGNGTTDGGSSQGENGNGANSRNEPNGTDGGNTGDGNSFNTPDQNP